MEEVEYNYIEAEDRDEVFGCDKCGYSTQYEEKLWKHENTDHSEQKIRRKERKREKSKKTERERRKRKKKFTKGRKTYKKRKRRRRGN